MSQYTKKEAAEVLAVAKRHLDTVQTKDETLAILKETGAEVSYAPTFRCLVIGMSPEDSIKWK